MKINSLNTDTIVALATPAGTGAIAVIRLSGKDAITICDRVFHSKNKKLSKENSHTIHLGEIKNEDIIIDEVLVSLFIAPHSYTGENVVEVSCHGSRFIQQELIQLFIHEGARLAKAGEFTLRAFLNKKLDLSQAEAVADLISSNSSASHQVAMQQMRGGFSNEIKKLREQLINFASLIELELDFSEEDVQFADRKELKKLISHILHAIAHLMDSFAVGNVIKHGIPVAIVGKPNAGKSTLLNTILNDDRAIVSEIAGTTRDTIEDEISIGGVLFRFIDTAGIRETEDSIEAIGVSKTYQKITSSAIVVYLFDVNELTSRELSEIKVNLLAKLPNNDASKLLFTGNKMDKTSLASLEKEFSSFPGITFISARDRLNMEVFRNNLMTMVNTGKIKEHNTIITNARHLEALGNTSDALLRVGEGIGNNTSGDLLATDIRTALHYLGEITGEISTDDLLKNIFSKFCIGK